MSRATGNTFCVDTLTERIFTVHNCGGIYSVRSSAHRQRTVISNTEHHTVRAEYVSDVFPFFNGIELVVLTVLNGSSVFVQTDKVMPACRYLDNMLPFVCYGSGTNVLRHNGGKYTTVVFHCHRKLVVAHDYR